jgi:hypothetical protein
MTKNKDAKPHHGTSSFLVHSSTQHDDDSVSALLMRLYVDSNHSKCIYKS